jgi:ABC-type microcin C transport system duplicated ATPase subunit YejF
MNADLLDVEGIGVHYPLRGARRWLRSPTLVALEDVSVRCAVGARVGIVGESGSGKSTLARVVLGLVKASSGRVAWRGQTVDYGNATALRALRREMQVVFQDPFGSLDPRMTAGQAIAEALHALAPTSPARDEANRRIVDVLVEVGLSPEFAHRYPHELSGGQCQRVAIARATIVRPRLLVCDEAVSALDVSVQAQIVNLLRDLSERHGMALLFISHNLAVVRHLCEDIVVLRRGRVIESGPGAQVFEAPREPYTRALLDAVPVPDPVVQRARVRKAVSG